MNKQALVAAILAATTLSATPAFAAQNPFKDMPEGHWAYDAVNMLVKDGVVDGYGDGTFGGDKLMNRYEMAEIVAKAAQKYGSVGMKDKGAIKKLTREFKAELKDMDARLTGLEQDVAALKKGQSSFKWYGDTRLRYFQNKNGKMTHPNTYWNNPQTGKERQWEKRMRLGMWAEPVKNVTVDARIKYEDSTDEHKGAEYSTSDRAHANYNDWDVSYKNQSSFRLDKAAFNWDNKGTRVSVGRIPVSVGQGGVWWDNPVDGFAVSHQFGPKVNIMAGYGDLAAEGWHDTTMWAYFTNVKYQASPATQFTFGTMHTNSTLSAAETKYETTVEHGYALSDSNSPWVKESGSDTWHKSNGSFWQEGGTWKGWDVNSNSSFSIDTSTSTNTGVKEAYTAKTTTKENWYDKDYKFNQYALGFNSQISNKVNLLAEGLYNNINGKNQAGGDLDKKGFWTRLTYGTCNWRKPGSWNLRFDYYALGNASIDSQKWGHRLDIAGGNSSWGGEDNRWGNGVRGWGIGWSYMLATNTNLDFSFYRLKPFDANASYDASNTNNGHFDRYDDIALASFTYCF